MPQYTVQKIGTLEYFKREMHADLSKVDFMVHECLNGETRELKIVNISETGPFLHGNCNLSYFDALAYLAIKCPNLKRVDLHHLCLPSLGTDIPAPWIRIRSSSSWITS